jgi:hypothetical protein
MKELKGSCEQSATVRVRNAWRALRPTKIKSATAPVAGGKTRQSSHNEAGARAGDPGGRVGESGEFGGTTAGAFTGAMTSMRRTKSRHSFMITRFDSMMSAR